MKMDRDRQPPPDTEARTWRRRPRIIQPALQLKYAALIAVFGTLIALSFCSLLWVRSQEARKEVATLCGSQAITHFTQRASQITTYTLTATAMIAVLLIV